MIRPAETRDLEAIAAIYTHYVEHTVITFDFESPTEKDWRARLEAAAARGHPWFVAVPGDDVAGYAYAAPFRTKPAYARTVETTVYLDPAQTGRGLGRALYEALLGELAGLDFHLVVAGMTLPNAASQALHRAVGFVPVGTFAQVGYKHGAWHDVEFLQRPLARE